MMVSFNVQKLFRFLRSNLSIAGLHVYAIGVLFRESFPVPIRFNVLPTFSSVRFKVSFFYEIHASMRFRVLGLHWGLRSIWSWVLWRVKDRTSFTCLQVAIQFDQTHVRYCLFSSVRFGSFVKNQVVVCGLQSWFST